MNEWPLVPLGELTENLDGRRVPVKENDRKPGPYPYYGASGIVDRVDGYLFDGEYLLIGEDGENLRTRQTPIAFMATGKFWVNNHAHIVRANHRADTRFLSYVLSQTDISGYLTGSTMPKLTQGNLNRLPVIAPPLAEQKAIAAVLGALDDKIELNRRMNATLEAMARALFQSWFVDFDPVRAKLDGRPPAALDPATAALFPEHLEDSPLGHIPKGWEVVSLEDLASIRGGKQLPTEDCLPVGKFAVFGANGIMGYATASTHDGFVIAFGRVGAYCGSIHWSLDGAWINNNASAVVPVQWPAFVLQTMLNIDFNSMRTGSAQPFIPNSSLASAKVLRPSSEIAEAFSRIVEPWRRQQANNDQESRTLATLRDTLLPKLLSGELSVADVESRLEAAR